MCPQRHLFHLLYGVIGEKMGSCAHFCGSPACEGQERVGLKGASGDSERTELLSQNKAAGWEGRQGNSRVCTSG